MPTSNILELYTELNDRVKEGRRFFVDTFKGEEYVDSTPKLTVIDLGAWQGDYSFYCLPFADKIYSIEPDIVPFRVLEETIKKFNLEDKIKIFNICIGADDRKRKMHFSHQGGSAFTEDYSNESEVECKSLATFIKDNQIEKVDILKIDVESAEYEIFSSPSFDEVADRIKYIIGEAHRGMDELVSSLEKRGFRVRPLNKGSLFEAIK